MTSDYHLAASLTRKDYNLVSEPQSPICETNDYDDEEITIDDHNEGDEPDLDYGNSDYQEPMTFEQEVLAIHNRVKNEDTSNVSETSSRKELMQAKI